MSIPGGDAPPPLDPQALLEELAKLRAKLFGDLPLLANAIKIFDKPGEFARDGEEACRMAASAITAALERLDYDEQTDVECVLALDASRRLIKNYASVNFEHLCSILSVVRSIASYVKDRSLSRPRNFMMLAAPGSGKSHLVECIADEVCRLAADAGGAEVEVVQFNMATMASKQDLIGVLNECRNIIVKRKMPLVFLDEFDAKKENYALLLPLLWDGKLDFENRPLMVGRSVFILAGSSKEIPEKLLEARRCQMPLSTSGSSDVKDKNKGKERDKSKSKDKESKQSEPPDESKIMDLFSRISGSVIEIPPFRRDGKIQPDKVVVAIALLRRRFKKCSTVPVGLLRFISRAVFRHGSRSIDTLINEIPAIDGQPAESLTELKFDQIKAVRLDTVARLRESPLAYHLQDNDGVIGVVKLWNECLASSHSQKIHSEIPS